MQVVQTVLELQTWHPIGQLKQTPELKVVDAEHAEQTKDKSQVSQLGGHARQSPDVDDSTYPTYFYDYH